MNIEKHQQEFIRFIETTKNLSSKTIRAYNSDLNDYFLYIRNNKIISKFLKVTTVKKIYFTTGYNTNNTLLYPYVTVLNYSICSSIKSLIDSSFKKVEKEYYGVLMNDETKKGINIDMLVSIPIYKILFIIITNLKDFIKVIKYLLKEEEINGRQSSTNQSVITNSDGLT